MAVFTLAAPPGTDLSKLRAKKVPAIARGLEKCCAFFSNGICRRPACAAFPCGHRDNAAVEAVLKSIDM